VTATERTRKWQQENREAYLQYRRDYYRANAKRINAAERARRAAAEYRSARPYGLPTLWPGHAAPRAAVCGVWPRTETAEETPYYFRGCRTRGGCGLASTARRDSRQARWQRPGAVRQTMNDAQSFVGGRLNRGRIENQPKELNVL
jgi:hypothetical protein